MKIIKLFGLLILLCLTACKNTSPNEQLQSIIKEYEKPREYDFDRNESVENTIKYYQEESDFALGLKEKFLNMDCLKLMKFPKNYCCLFYKTRLISIHLRCI